MDCSNGWLQIILISLTLYYCMFAEPGAKSVVTRKRECIEGPVSKK